MNRVSTNIALTAFVALVAYTVLAGTASAQLGEVAGPLSYNVSLGGTETLNMTIFNSGTVPLPYKVIPPLFKTSTANTTKPVITIAPMEGVLQPRQSQKIAVTITIPAQHNKPGYYWSGILQVLEVSNSTQQGVAVIQGGVAKGVNVTATPSTFDPLEVAIPAAIIIIIAAIAVLWKKGVIKVGAQKKAKASAPSKKSSAKAKKTSAKSKKAGARKRPASKRRKASTKRRPSSAKARARRRRR